MSLVSALDGNALIVGLKGRLDQDNCDAFRDELTPHLDTAARDHLAIVLDLSQLEYVSSAGLRCFMLAVKQAKTFNGRIVVAALQPMVAEIFQISRFDMLLNVFETVAAAKAGVATDASDQKK
ncbi:MAG: STAS domain-containing protein [Burkholderiales bacterium]|nr:STAS domain-containing protein [Burkholderiales bacterium]